MRVDLVRTRPLTSSFLSCEKDAERIFRKLFIENQPYSDELKRLLIINTKDCIDKNSKHNDKYASIVRPINISNLKENGYIKLEPKVRLPEHEEVKSYVILTFDGFIPNAQNPEFRDCTVTFDIICHTDYWDLGNYQSRPLKIAGYIDSLLDKERFTGIGTLQFAGCNELILSEDLSGYTLMYRAIHGSDDWIPDKELK